MRKIAIATALTLGAAAVAGIAGLVATAIVDTGSAVVIAAVVALGLLVIGLIEWSHRRRHQQPATAPPVGSTRAGTARSTRCEPLEPEPATRP